MKFDIDPTKEDIIGMYNDFIEYAQKVGKLKCKHRQPNFPEHISEHLIKYIINNYCDYDHVCKRVFKNGDLYMNDRKIECKTVSSNGPISFGPNTTFSELFILDNRGYLINNPIILYRINIDDTILKTIQINKKETFGEQSNKNRRPRINWESFYKQIVGKTEIIFQGTIKELK